MNLLWAEIFLIYRFVSLHFLQRHWFSYIYSVKTFKIINFNFYKTLSVRFAAQDTSKLYVHEISEPPPPPKKKGPFFFWGGGLCFFEIKSSIFGIGDIKTFGKTRVLSGPNQQHFGRLSANIGQKHTIEILKIWHF